MCASPPLYPEIGSDLSSDLDVFPEEPLKNGPWKTDLMGMPNVLLTPHIGGSTEEVQLWPVTHSCRVLSAIVCAKR